MTSHQEINGIHYFWCVWCRAMVRMDVPHVCVNKQFHSTVDRI